MSVFDEDSKMNNGIDSDCYKGQLEKRRDILRNNYSFINDKEDVQIDNDFVEEEQENKENQNIDDEDKIQYDNDVMNQEMKDESKIITKINNTLNDKKLLKFIKFDETKDNVLYNEELKNHFTKNYIFNTFIKLSDTIQDIKNKIFFTIKNSSKYGNVNLLEPSRIYLWSEYMYKDKYELYQLGKEIMENNKLLKFPIEPMNLDNYINPDYSNKDYDFIKK